MVFKSYDILRKADISNINLDLMFAIPNQTKDVWRQTLKEAWAMDSEHLSCYEVIYEEDTALYAQLKAGEFDVDEDLACDMYEMLVDQSGEAGFERYEIANFAKTRAEAKNEFPSLACQHNVNYWRGGCYYGLGPSATGYVRGRRRKNVPNTQLYCERVEKDGDAAESGEELSPLARAGEVAAFGLRVVAGWPFELFKQRTGFDLREEWGEAMEGLIQRGWGIQDGERFRLTGQGLRFADAAGAEFVR
jgi:oxygen-independent coproporphyrinogen-3 oxidase